MGLMKQTDFARRHNVSRKTVTEWKKGGYLAMQGDLVDAEASDARLRGRRRGRSGEGGAVTPTVTHSVPTGQGNKRGNSRGNKRGNAGNDVFAEGAAGFTPEAEALLTVLNREGPCLFDRFLAAYGVPVVERMKACEGFVMTLGYIGQGLYVGTGADLHAWDFDVLHPDFSDARQVVDAVDAQMEPIIAEMQDRENDPESAPYAAIQAGRRARVNPVTDDSQSKTT